jgi:hypothetical protein
MEREQLSKKQGSRGNSGPRPLIRNVVGQQRKLDPLHPPCPSSSPRPSSLHATQPQATCARRAVGRRPPDSPVSPSTQWIPHAILARPHGCRSPRAGTLDNPHTARCMSPHGPSRRSSYRQTSSCGKKNPCMPWSTSSIDSRSGRSPRWLFVFVLLSRAGAACGLSYDRTIRM